MATKIINYSHQSIDTNDLKSVNKAINSGILTQGKEVKNFENKLKNYFSSKYASAVSSGTAALHLTSSALGWKKNDFIVTTPLTFIATANSILYKQANPIFVDTNLNDYQLDLNQLETKLKKNKKIKAVIAVDYAGNPCDWINLKYLSKKYSFKLINDNCHALGAKYNGQKNYATKYADVVTQSFHPLKNITTGEGGAISTNNNIYANELMIKLAAGSSGKAEIGLNFTDFGFNFRLTEIQALMGWHQLKIIDEMIARRLEIKHSYINSLVTLGFRPQKINDNIKHNTQSIVFTVPKGLDRNKLVKYLFSQNIESTLGTYCLSGTSFNRNKYDDVQKNSLAIEASAITLPCFDDLDITPITQAIEKFIKENG